MFLDNLASDETLIRVLALKKLLLQKDDGKHVNRHLLEKISVESVATIYKLAHLFNLENISEVTFSYIERCFTMVVKTSSFLELNYLFVKKILSSVNLNITSELQVFNVIETWVNYDNTVRRQFMNSLFKHCISRNTLKKVLRKSVSFKEESLSVVNDVLMEKMKLGSSSSKCLESRFCEQESFNILFCGGIIFKEGNNRGKWFLNLKEIDGKSFEGPTVFAELDKTRQLSKMVNLKSDIYIFGGLTNRAAPIKSIEKYSLTTNKHEVVADMFDERDCFCACALTDKIYFIGGCINIDTVLDTCLQFDTNVFEFEEVAKMNVARKYAACTVFDGRIVVSGGHDGRLNWLNSVEAYDPADETWTYMASMIEDRVHHKSAAGRNKIFVIGGHLSLTCEVFDASCNKFVALKISLQIDQLNLEEPVEAIVNGKNFYVFTHYPTNVICYDLDKDEWSEQKCEAIGDHHNFCCLKIPRF